MTDRVVHLLSSAGPHDAVTNQALAHARLLRSWGVESEVFAGHLAPGLDGAVDSADALADSIGRRDLLVLHYTAYAPGLDGLVEVPDRRMLVYHNVTPPELLWDYEPLTAARCALGRERLASYATRVDHAATATRFNAGDLERAGFADIRVVPSLYFFDRSRLEPRSGIGFADGKRNVVFVGRLVANKRQDELIKAFALYQRHREPESRLILVGGRGPGTDYPDHLEQVAQELGVRDVVLTGGLPQEEVNAIYASASVFVCLSEHEGFCLPLLEAFHFGLPVIAYRAGAVPEVAGDAAILLDEKHLPTIAELIDLCARDEELRAELARRGEARLAEFEPGRTEAELRELFQSLL